MSSFFFDFLSALDAEELRVGKKGAVTHGGYHNGNRCFSGIVYGFLKFPML